MIPSIAGPRAERCRATTQAMREVASRAVGSAPDRLVLISPHSPRHASAYAAWAGHHQGDLGDFGAPDLQVALPDAPEVARTLGLPRIGDATRPPPQRSDWLDHGAMVPLWFLVQAGWRGPTAILALPWAHHPDAEELGQAIAELPGRTAVIASGDMSHRLIQGAPAGYHPDAQAFDDAFVAALVGEDWVGVPHTPHREDAAEDVVESTRVAMAAVGSPCQSEVLHYEGPWGVGYTEAILWDPTPPPYAVARQAIRAHVLGGNYTPPKCEGPPSHGVFVTLTKNGALRGCIGQLAPGPDGTYADVASRAVLACSEDPRFPPVEGNDLAALEIEVSLLSPPEDISTPAQLDPSVYGVVVQAGYRRGVLLPAIDGIDTVDRQLKIAREKGGIATGESVTLQRFRVDKDCPP